MTSEPGERPVPDRAVTGAAVGFSLLLCQCFLPVSASVQKALPMALTNSLTAPPEKKAHRVFADATDLAARLTPGYPVYCVRPNRIMADARRFLRGFPGRTLYAVKCNPHPMVLRAIHAAGVRHYDTASLGEIAQVRELFRDATAYFMHPVKSRAAILSAEQVYGVGHFVVDHPDELQKVIETTQDDEITLFVRLATSSKGAVLDLSRKFGATVDQAVAMLDRIHREGYRAGIAFHVGSQCRDPAAFRDALKRVGLVLARTEAEIHYLDVGGGFPAPYVGEAVPPLEDFFKAIEAGVRQLNLRRDAVLMCEPGRAMVASGLSLLVQVQLRKGDSLYINDGVYHSLSEPLVFNNHLPVRLVRPGGPVARQKRDFTVYGPTCDSHDVLPTPFTLPEDVREGDWIEVGQVGAYSNALATGFNGFKPETFVELEDEPPGPKAA